jgi:polyisoprenoid-binding protein YceI
VDNAEAKKSRAGLIKWIALGVVGVVVLAYAGIFIYTKIINDSPDKLDESDLSEALATTTVRPADSAETSDPAVTEPVATDATEATNSLEPSAPVSFDGDWVPTTASEFGYRVKEVIAGVSTTAVGRSNEIEGLLVIDGTQATTVDIEVQIENITSDDSRRDGRFSGAIMNSSEFPTATFTLIEPIDFGEPPSGDGGQVVATATGELTLRGVTNPVTFAVTAEANNDRIGILGSIPVVFADYGIDNPSFGAVKTEDEGLVEFVLVFERS